MSRYIWDPNQQKMVPNVGADIAERMALEKYHAPIRNDIVKDSITGKQQRAHIEWNPTQKKQAPGYSIIMQDHGITPERWAAIVNKFLDVHGDCGVRECRDLPCWIIGIPCLPCALCDLCLEDRETLTRQLCNRLNLELLQNRVWFDFRMDERGFCVDIDWF